jgi:murein DD-endopeptidase MepM/ murein hydrolase activator NlpD
MTYKKTKKIRRILQKAFTYFVSSIVLAVIYYILFALVFNTPYEQKLAREYSFMRHAYDSLESNYIQAKNVLNRLKKEDSIIYRSVFKTNPIEMSSTSGLENVRMMNIAENYNIVRKTSDVINQLSQRIENNKTKIEESIEKINNEKEMLKYIPAIQPVENKDLKYTGASVGLKIHPFYRIAKMHKGIDYTVPLNTKVVATANGIVENIMIDDAEKGTAIYIDHQNGYKTVYAHLGKPLVRKGENVKRGQIIALSGDTGLSIFPHLHYEVWKDGHFIDPISSFFAELHPDKIQQIIEISSNIGQSLD